MKTRRLVLILVSIVLLSVSPAFASYWTLSPVGQVDTEIGDQIAYTLTFNCTETIVMAGWDLDFQFDTNELTPVWDSGTESWKITYNDFGQGFASLFTDNGDVVGNTYTLAAASMSNLTITAGTSLLFATIYMDVIADQIWDDLADMVLVSQIGTDAKGILLSDFVTIVQFAGADGASVGSPVPLPGAVWLLGSGLLGLIGVRRRARS